MNGDKADGGHCVTPECAVKGMLKDVGKESLTYGCHQHAKGMFMCTSVFPTFFLKKLFYGEFCKLHE